MNLCGRWTYDSANPDPRKRSVFIENKEPHYVEAYPAGLAECLHTPRPPSKYGARSPDQTRRSLPPPMQLSVTLTSKNSTQRARRKQAELFAAAGYRGPIQAGEVKALKNLLTKLGRLDHVVHGWILKQKHRTRGWRQLGLYLHGPCYLFKSPIPGLDFTDFIMLARMYKDGKGLKEAVGALLKRVPAELKTEAETFRTIDVLAGLGEKA